MRLNEERYLSTKVVYETFKYTPMYIIRYDMGAITIAVIIEIQIRIKSTTYIRIEIVIELITGSVKMKL